MGQKKCIVCKENVAQAFSAVALRKHPFDAISCSACGILRVENPHWLEEAYSNAVADADTGLVARNINLSNQIARC